MRVALLLAFAVLVAPASAGAAAPSGRNLYLRDCASCHGGQLEGVRPDEPGRGAGVRDGGPSLRGVGALAVDFELRTGYMPLHDAYEQPLRSAPSYSGAQIKAIVAYIARTGGPPIPQPHPERGSLSEGMRLFTESCAGCHQVAGAGGIVTNRIAPSLTAATATQIAEAVRLGPYVMPRFDRRRISDRQLDSIVRYVEYAKHPQDRGGWELGHLGPVPEGMVAWLIAGSVLLLVARLIGEARK